MFLRNEFHNNPNPQQIRNGYQDIATNALLPKSKVQKYFQQKRHESEIENAIGGQLHAQRKYDITEMVNFFAGQDVNSVPQMGIPPVQHWF